MAWVSKEGGSTPRIQKYFHFQIILNFLSENVSEIVIQKRILDKKCQEVPVSIVHFTG